MTERKHDERLDDYLRGDSPLTRAYREAGREQPPAHLDAALLAQAKAEFLARRASKPRWRMPLSLAATVVLAVGVVLFATREGAGPLPPEAPSAPEPTKAPETKVPAPKAPAVVPKEAPRFDARDVAVPPREKTPEEWLADIEELRKLGLDADADAQLAEFRKRYPDYPIKR